LGVSDKNKQIIDLIKRGNLDSYKVLNDLVDMARVVIDEDGDIEYAMKITNFVIRKVQTLPIDEDMNELYWNARLVEAPYRFESFMLYMEKNRSPEERFYQPRMNPLHIVAEAIQDLRDDKLDELFINMPGRVGKTQIVKFAFVWFGSGNTELSNLYTAFSDKITKAFYTGCIELITDPTYTYNEIFPNNRIVSTNGDDEIVDLNRKKTYPTFTCRSIYGTLNGACDCNGLAIDDDLFSGIQEAISPDRQTTVWGIFDNNFMKRLKRKAKLINMGTRWALGDVQGRRRDLLENNVDFRGRRYRVISIPALDENDESNFDYPYNLGYSTQDYKMTRASFEANDDMASWFAQDQQEPIERQGALFTSDNMRFYNGVLPQEQPDRIFMYVDEAFGGGDYVSGPVCYQYGDVGYIPGVVYNNGDKFVTRPLVAEKIMELKVQAVKFEETRTTSDYHEGVEEILKKNDYKCNIMCQAPGTQKSKSERIFDKAPEIREMYFLEQSIRPPEYEKFMLNMYAFKMFSKNKQHDDAPDSMAGLCNMKHNGYAQCMVLTDPRYRLY